MSATKQCILFMLLSILDLSSSFQSASFITNLASVQTLHHQHAIHQSVKPSFLPSIRSTAIQMSSYPPEDTNYEVSIEYCTGCHWMPRATWMAQELLSTFQDELDIVSLIPSRPGSDSNPNGGKFAVSLNGELLWDRAFETRFPEIKELKCLVRDFVCPDRDLGHLEKINGQEPDDEDSDTAEIEALVKEIEAIDEEIKILDKSIGVMEKQEVVEEESEKELEVVEESAPVMVLEESAPVVVEETAPVVEESVPVVEESVPVVEESVPVVEESVPVVEESEPVAEETVPVAEESEPVIEEPEPVAEEIAPVVEKKEPEVRTLFTDFIGFETL